MKQELEQLLAKAREAQSVFKAAVRQEQLVCKHTSVAECEYLDLHDGPALPPMRVCLGCGMTERGWSGGYVVLTSPAERISRDGLYARRHGFEVNSAHKDQLAQGVTLAQLVAASN